MCKHMWNIINLKKNTYAYVMNKSSNEINMLEINELINPNRSLFHNGAIL